MDATERQEKGLVRALRHLAKTELDPGQPSAATPLYIGQRSMTVSMSRILAPANWKNFWSLASLTSRVNCNFANIQ